MDDLEKARLKGAREALLRLAQEAANQNKAGVSVVLIKQMALMDDAGLAAVLKEAPHGK